MVILRHFKVVSFKTDSVVYGIFSFNFQKFYSCQMSVSRKNSVPPIEKFPSLSLPRNVIMLQQLIIFNFCSIICGRLREVKTKESFKLLALKVVAVAYERWSLTRGSKCNDLTWKLLVFWKTDR